MAARVASLLLWAVLVAQALVTGRAAEPYGAENFDIESGSVEATPGCVDMEKEYQDKCMSQAKLDQGCLQATSKYYAECVGTNKPK